MPSLLVHESTRVTIRRGHQPWTLEECISSGLAVSTGRILGELKERGLPDPTFESSRFDDEFVTVFPLGNLGHGGGAES